MKIRACIMLLLLSGSALSGTGGGGHAQPAAVPPPGRDIIIILRDQRSDLTARHGASAARAAALASAQTPIVDHLGATGATHIHSFALINAVAAHVSQAEAEQLAVHPLVQAVVDDKVMRLPKSRRAAVGRGAAADSAPAAPAAVPPAAGSNADLDDLCGTLEPQALQLTHTAFLDKSIPQAQTVIDGNGVPISGEGVKVAFIADGLDPTIDGFVRPDGTSVFFDYQDFSGDPAGSVTFGGEAFGDASSIAAQDLPNGQPLTFDISQFVNPVHPLPSPCNIRIRGVAPGASLAALKVFGFFNSTTHSTFVQAIEWAVTHDDVDVINESFGGAVFPDNANDPISLANRAAVAAGVTVVVSSGDAGTEGAIESPASDLEVIAVGASTQFRWYAQNGAGAAPLAHGYLNDNIAPFSSGGFSQSGARTIDVVAPGDLSWALCSTEDLYFECVNDVTAAGGPSPIETFGGTSESAPLTAGEAALVIQAYRTTHDGASPAPALVKRIIMSTATDLGAPAYEQGAGLIDALKAVRAAMSVHDETGAPKAQGDSLLYSPTSAAVMGEPNSSHHVSFTIHNTGATTQHLTPVLQTLGAPIAGGLATVKLNPAVDPSFMDYFGDVATYVEQRFTVPDGAQHLDAAIAFPQAGAVLLSLLDPSGKQAAYTSQGVSNTAHLDVVKPKPGEWKAVIYNPSSGPDSFPYVGQVQFSWSAERYERFGSVVPEHLDIQPGATAIIKAALTLPAQSGDTAAAIRVDAGSETSTLPEIPLRLRTLVPIGGSGGNFTGTLTGGNGTGSPYQTYVFDVPQGVNNMSLTLEIADSGYLLQGVLVDPHGMPLSVEANMDTRGLLQHALQLFRTNPGPGRWRFILSQYLSFGNQTSLPFTARIGFDTAQVSAPGLPDDKTVTLSARGGPVKIALRITNTGALTQAYFADARLREWAVAELPPLICSPAPPASSLPNGCGLFNLPTQAKHVSFTASSSAPLMMDAYDITGNPSELRSPDINARKTVTNTTGTNTVMASLSEPEIPFGPWFVSPSLIGPFGQARAFLASLATAAQAVIRPFDPAVSASSGDYWADITFGTTTYNPLFLTPGATDVINLTIKPDPSLVGHVVSGYIYVDTFNTAMLMGDEVVRIPYEYTVGP